MSVLNKNIDPIGPMWTGGFVDVQTADEESGVNYTLLFLPDKNNNLLREAGKPMCFYYALDTPRLARRPNGDYMFGLQKFSGVMDPTKNIGTDGYSELAGGYLTFTTTLKIPEAVMEKGIENLKAKIEQQYSTYDLWKLPPALEPNVAPIPIIDNITKIHEVTARAGDDSKNELNGDNLTAWGWKMQGEGKGSLNPLGNNAFSAMLGQYPVQLIDGGAKSGTSNIVVENNIRFKVWTPVTEIRVTGDWSKVYDHLSTSFQFKSIFTNVDISTEMNKLVTNGAIKVELKFDSEFVDGAKQENYEKGADAIVETFIKLAEKAIFNEAKPDVEAAKADPSNTVLGSYGWFMGSGFSLKQRKDITELSLNYEKKIDYQLIKDSRQSAQMAGLFTELKANPEAYKKYFSEIFLEEGFRKVHVIASANAYWKQPDGRKGDPINKLMLQVGYPDSQGNINWKSAARYKDKPSDTEFSKDAALASWDDSNKDRIYAFDFTRQESLGEDSEKIYIKKIISFDEDPRVVTNQVVIEEETEQHVIEVRAETSGKLSVGPVSLDMPIDSEQVEVQVKFWTDGMEEQVYDFNYKNADQPRYWEVWYEKPEDLKGWEYKVEAIVKGKRFGQKAVRWESDWLSNEGNGPLIAEIPEVPSSLEDKLETYLS